MLNITVINVISTKSINYNITLILIYVLIYTYVYLKINIYPRCCISDALHELTPRSAGQQLTQKPYESHFLFQKECSKPYKFCREANNVGWVNCACIIHGRAIIFCTCNQIMFIINNIKKVFNYIKKYFYDEPHAYKSILLLFVLFLCCLIN